MVTLLIFATLGILTAIVIVWNRRFKQSPIQATLRSTLALLALLIGSIGAPAVTGSADVTIDLAPILQIQSHLVRVESGSELTTAIAFAGLFSIVVICLLRTPVAQTT